MEERGSIERVEAVVPPGVEVLARRRTVVSALPLKRAAQQRLAQLLDARVLDIRDDCPEPDLVLAPSSSPQLIGRLRERFPGAHVVVVELDDDDLDIELGGPVKRLLRSGVDAYLLADSLDELAAKLGTTFSTSRVANESAGDEVRELHVAQAVDDLGGILRDAQQSREQQELQRRQHEA